MHFQRTVLVVFAAILTIGCGKGFDPSNSTSESSKQCLAVQSIVASPFTSNTNSIKGDISIFAAESTNYVSIDFNKKFVSEITQAYSSGQQSVSFPLTLPNSLTITAVSKEIKIAESKIIVMGAFLEDPSGYFIFSIRNDVLAGTVNYLLDSYSIRYSGQDIHTFAQNNDIDEAISCDTDESLAGDDGAEASQLPSEEGGSVLAGDTVDIIVGFTSAAKDQTGGLDSTLALVDLEVEKLNKSLANSGIEHRVRLVGSVELTAPSAGTVRTDLESLFNSNDGKWDEMHTEAMRLGADVTAVLVEGSATGNNGVAYIPSANGTTYYSISRIAASRFNVFQHEVGHNFGAQHADGLEFDGVGTLMTYSNSRILHYSNPNVMYNNSPTGTNTKNAAATVDSRMPTASRNRAAVTPPPPTTTPPPTTAPPPSTPPPGNNDDDPSPGGNPPVCGN